MFMHVIVGLYLDQPKLSFRVFSSIPQSANYPPPPQEKSYIDQNTNLNDFLLKMSQNN